MLHQAQTIYAQLLDELQACSGTVLERQVVCSFQAADRCWRTLQKQVCTYRFPAPEAEITFFRQVKPMFTAEIRYQSLCYCALLFQPLCPCNAASFWTRERDRLLRFQKENRVFYSYYKEGKTHLDEGYFLRERLDRATLATAAVYDDDPRALTNCDPLVATLLALEKFRDFAAARLREQDAAV